MCSNGFCTCEERIEKGRQSLAKNRPEKALNQFEKALIEWDLDKHGFGKLSEIERVTAETLRRLGKPEDALQRANAAIRHALYVSNDRQLKPSLTVRAHIRLMLEDYKSALSDAHSALERLADWQEENYRALEIRAAALSGLGRFEKAIENYFEQLRIAKELRMPSEKLAEVYFNMGNTYRQNREYKRALDAYGQAVEEHPESALYYYTRGTLYEDLEKMDMAKIDMARAKKLDPTIWKKVRREKKKKLVIWQE